MLFIGMVAGAQQDNVFHKRDFWKANPSLETVKQKITEGNDPTSLDVNAFDAVINALLENVDTAVIKHLLSYKENAVDKVTHDSRIYLHWAAYAGSIEMVHYLLEKGSSVTKLDSNGNTPLTFAANAGQKNTALYETFEKYGVNLVTEKNENGANVLLLVAPFLTTENELNYFVSKGIDMHSKDSEGNGIFNYATKKAQIDFLKMLVHKGVDYKSLNKNKGNAFLFAAQGTRNYSNPLPVYTYLKSLGLEPNVVPTDGFTPLHRLALSNTDLAIFNFFLEAGASVNLKDSKGNTPFLNAAWRNELAVVKWLAQHVQDYNSTNNNGQTAFMLSISRNKPEVSGFLIKMGCDTFIKDNVGNTVAYYLVQSFNSEKSQEFDSKLNLLLENGHVMHTTQADGNTLIHLAAKDNKLPLLQRLTDFNIDINAKNDEGLTALHIAAMKADSDLMMKYLITKGADTKIQTDFEETAFDLATENELLKKKNTALTFLK